MNVVVAMVLLLSGTASRYDPGVFERTVRIRQGGGSLPQELPDHDGTYIALLSPELIGQVVLVCTSDQCRFALVADCAGRSDGTIEWMRNDGISGELDYATAIAMDSTSRAIEIFAAPLDLVGLVPGRAIKR